MFLYVDLNTPLHAATLPKRKMKTLLILVAVISPVTPLSNLFKRQSQDPTDSTSTTTQPPSPCAAVVSGGDCYPLSQCSGAIQSSDGVYLIPPGSPICGWSSGSKEPYLCCNKIQDTTTTSETTTMITTITTTTPEPPFECARIKTPGFGIIWKRNEVRAINAKPFIVGGNDTGKDVYPYMAALFYQDVTNKTRPFCGASIISRRSLLTAAHCFIYQDPDDKYVAVIGDYILGNSLDESNPIEVQVERIILHPDYKAGLDYNDIAILVLKESLNFSEGITPVCLPSKELFNETFAGLNAVVTGWGQDATSGRYKATLQSAVIPVIAQQECQNVYSGLSGASETLPDGITDDLLCAGLYNDTRRDACQGDSGGPLVASDQNGTHWIQIGVVASGVQCGSVYPGLYTRTTHYLDWIATNRVA